MHRGAFKLIVGKAEAFPRKGSLGKGATSIKKPAARSSAGGLWVVGGEWSFAGKTPRLLPVET